MFPFKKKTQPIEPKPETLNEGLRRRFEETDTRLGEAVRKMQNCVNQALTRPNLKVVK